jgi:hypothetical protein
MLNKSLQSLIFFVLVLLATALPGCAVVGGIFKAGVWVGVLAVVIVVGLILFLVSRGSKKE